MLASLLDLNLELAEQEAEGKAIAGTWDQKDENSLRPKRTEPGVPDASQS